MIFSNSTFINHAMRVRK